MTVTPFGTPLPPNNLTPPPLVPMNPNRSLMPQQPLAAPNQTPLSGVGSTSGGRFGR